MENKKNIISALYKKRSEQDIGSLITLFCRKRGAPRMVGGKNSASTATDEQKKVREKKSLRNKNSAVGQTPDLKKK